MDAHLIHIPSLGTLSARSLTGADLELLGGQADGALDAEVLGLGALNELAGDLLKGLNLLGGEGDADLVHLRAFAGEVLFGLGVGHDCGFVVELFLGGGGGVSGRSRRVEFSEVYFV